MNKLESKPKIKDNGNAANARALELTDLTSGRYKVIYDLEAMPNQAGIATLLQIADLHHFIFYDSSKKGRAPRVVYLGDNPSDEVKFQLVDVKDEAVDFAVYLKAREEEFHWLRELDKCKDSPIHYYTHYVSLTAKTTPEELTTWMVSKKMIEDKDSDSSVLTEKEKKARQKFAKGISIERLKNLKAIREEAVRKEAEVTKQKNEALCLPNTTISEMEVMTRDTIAQYDAEKATPYLAGTDYETYTFRDLDAKKGESDYAWSADVLECTELEFLVKLVSVLESHKVPKCK